MSCPVCFSPDTLPGVLTGTDALSERTARIFALSTCFDCRSLFIEPRPEQQELAAFYPPHYWWSPSSTLLSRFEGAYRRFVLRDHVSFIMKSVRGLGLAPQSVELLDVGCGSATLLSLLKTRGIRTHGFDASAAAAESAHKAGISVRTGRELKDAGFAESSFDIITLFHVLEHVTDPRRLVHEVSRLLKPGGRLIVQVPNIDSWQSRLFGPSWSALDIPRHVIDYSNDSVHRLLSECGFRVLKVCHFNLRDNAPALASSLIPSLDPIRRRFRQRSSKRESPLLSHLLHSLYFGLAVAAIPFALAEAAAGAGATVMIEAARHE